MGVTLKCTHLPYQLECKPLLSRDRLVVRTLRCGRSNPGSNPGHGKTATFFPHFPSCESSGKKKATEKYMRRPGIEPGSTAWKAAMLTIIPPTLAYQSAYWIFKPSGISTNCHQGDSVLFVLDPMLN